MLVDEMPVGRLLAGRRDWPLRDLDDPFVEVRLRASSPVVSPTVLIQVKSLESHDPVELHSLS
jgi:hypothetical protein